MKSFRVRDSRDKEKKEKEKEKKERKERKERRKVRCWREVRGMEALEGEVNNEFALSRKRSGSIPGQGLVEVYNPII